MGTSRTELFPAAGWTLLSFLFLLSPLIQGGTPRLPTAALQVAVLLLVAAWAFQWGWRSPVQAQRLAAIDLLLAVFLFFSLFAMLFAPYQHSALKTLLALLCFSSMYWCLSFNPSRKGYALVIRSLWAQGLLQASLAWYQWLRLGAERPPGTFYNPNFMASFLVVAVFLGPASVLFALDRGERRTFLSVASASAAAVIMAGAVVLSESRGAMVALAAGGMVLLAGRSVRLALAGAGALAAGLAVLPNPLTERLAGLGQTDAFAYSRLSIWRSALQMWADHPWLGVGLGQYKFFSPRYAFPVDHHWAKYGKVAENPHSEYLLAGAETGLLGAVPVFVAVIALAAWTFGKIRASGPEARGHLIPLAAGMTALLTHSAVDFPLHVPSLALLVVFMAASLRLWGAVGPSVPVEFRFRRLYGILVMGGALFLALQAVRPVAGFWHFLGAIGAPQNMFREKWSLEEAPRRTPEPEVSIPLLRRAIAFDPGNAAYHNALGSRYFQTYLRGSEEGEARRRALFHANYASQLNPNNHRYQLSLAQAMESLSRRLGDTAFLAAAEGHYRKALELAPRDYNICEKIAVMAEAKGDIAGAEGMFREAVRLEPNYLRGWYNLAVFLARHGRMEEAGAAIRKGMKAAGEGYGDKAATPYERDLVDFDTGLFLKWLEQAEAGT